VLGDGHGIYAAKIVDLLAKPWLRNVQPIRGMGKFQLLCRSDEIF
jgi:hypothetical protein